MALRADMSLDPLVAVVVFVVIQVVLELRPSRGLSGVEIGVGHGLNIPKTTILRLNWRNFGCADRCPTLDNGVGFDLDRCIGFDVARADAHLGGERQALGPGRGRKHAGLESLAVVLDVGRVDLGDDLIVHMQDDVETGRVEIARPSPARP